MFRAKSAVVFAIFACPRAYPKGPQGQLADMAHMTKSYMSEIEAGKKNLTLRSTAKIADCLGVTLEELFRGV